MSSESESVKLLAVKPKHKEAKLRGNEGLCDNFLQVCHYERPLHIIVFDLMVK